LIIAGVGVATGVLVGFLVSRVITRYSAEMQLPGALPLIASAAVILAAALIASALPAVRAARVDAVQALRSE
jgi:ABC-type antimicrobial peptide transport system permease subunit